MHDVYIPEGDDEPPIMLVALDRNSYHLLKGEEFLSQMLLMDGEYPKPILCVHFASAFDASLALGEEFSVTGLWAVHPEIIARLRATNCLIEKEG